ncbi:MAG: T9SS type A sorting domain-containing protein [Bacteroidia bacterium]
MKKELLAALALISFNTINAQDSWTRSEPAGFGSAYDQYITCIQPFKGDLYAGSADYSGGLYKSATGTIGSWTSSLTGPMIRKINNVATTAEGGGYIYASVYSFGVDSPRVFRSFDGSTWTPYLTGPSDPFEHIVPFKGTGAVDSIYVVENIYSGMRILRSGYATNDPNNLSMSWDTVFDLSGTYTKVNSTLVHSGRFYIGTSDGQIFGTNDGTNWTRNDSVNFGFNDAGNYAITAMEAFGGYIYAGTMNYSGAQLWRSPDQVTWTQVAVLAQCTMITDLESTGTELWVAGENGNGGGAVVQRSTDGVTFINSSTDGFGDYNNHGEEGHLKLFGNNMYYGARNYGGGGALAHGGKPSVRGGGMSTGGQIWRTCLIAPPVLNLGADMMVCAGQPTNLDAGAGAIAYNWSTGETTQIIAAMPGIGSAADYYCQVTAASGCDAIDHINVFSKPSPSVTTITPTASPYYLCKGDTVAINTTAVSGLYIMDPPAVRITHDTIIDYTDNWDTLAVSGITGPVAGTSLISFTIDSLSHTYLSDVRIGIYAPDGSYSDVDLYGHGGGSSLGFRGTEFRLDAAGDLNSGTPPYTGQFLPDMSWTGLTGNANGNWVVKTSDVAGGDQGNLLGWTLKFGSPDTVMTFSWSPATGLTSTTTINTMAFPAVATNYALTVTGSNGCSSTDTVRIDVPFIDIPAASAAVCYGSSYTVTTSGGSSSSSTTWTPTTDLDTGTGPVVVTTPTANVTYYVSDYVNGCVVGDSIQIIANSQVFATASLPQTMCFADSVILSATPAGGTPSYTYNWNNGSVNIPGQNITVSPTTSAAYTLTVTDSYGCTGTDYTNVVVNPSTNLTGHVSYSGGAVTTGNVVAFHYIPTYTKFDSIQVTTLNASGDYTFTALDSRNYLIKVFPDTLVYPTLNSTYYGNVFNWDSATVYSHGCTAIDTANITMVEETGFAGGGIGFLRGRITEDVGFGRAPGDPIPGLDVKLGKNPGGAMVTSGTTNSGGYYTFTNVDFNAAGENYVVYVDIPGLGTDSSYTFTVDATTPQYLYLDYVVDSTTIHFVPNAGVGISNPSVAIANKFNVYPNPFRTESTVEYSTPENAEVALEVYNVLGDKIYTIANEIQNEGNHKYQVSGLDSGVYFVKLSVNGNSTTQRIVVMD